MGTLFDGQRDNDPYKSSSFAIYPIINQATTIMPFLVDGIFATISFGPKSTKNKVVHMLSRTFVNASIISRHGSLSHESYIEKYARD